MALGTPIHVSALLLVVTRMRSRCVTPMEDTTGIPSPAGVITTNRGSRFRQCAKSSS